MLWNLHGFLNLLFQVPATSRTITPFSFITDVLCTYCLMGSPFFRHFSGNSLVLVLADFSMNFRMHLSNSKNNSLAIFLWASLSTYLVSIYTVHYNMLIFFLSGNVFLCDVRDWTSVTWLLGKCSTAELCPLETWYIPRNMYMFLQIDLACFLHDCLPRYFCLL